MRVYADTSFLASLYVPEGHSEQARGDAAGRIAFFQTPLGELELKNSFHLRVFRKEMKPTDLRMVVADLQKISPPGIFKASLGYNI